MLTNGQRKVVEANLNYKRDLLKEVRERHKIDEKLIPELEQGIEALEKRLEDNE